MIELDEESGGTPIPARPARTRPAVESGKDARKDGEPAGLQGRVLAIHGAQTLVEVDGKLYRCYLSGKLKYRRESTDPASRIDVNWRRDTRESRGRWVRSRAQAPPSSPVAVGDYVRVRVGEDGSGMILGTLDRKGWLGRMRPTKGPQVIAANVEIALAVMSVADPAPDFYLLDQFLIQAAAGGLEPWVIFNKIDLLPEPRLSAPAPAAAENLENAAPVPSCAFYPEAQVYRDLGYRVFCTSAATRDGVDALDAALNGRTAVFVGPSGVGKSTLLNDLIPVAEARTAEISEWSGRGQHTTTHVAMYPLPRGGYLVDAPGIRTLALWQVPAQDLCRYFPEFGSFAEQCESSRCAHLNEAECAVRDAAQSGELSWRRYRHYCQMRQG